MAGREGRQAEHGAVARDYAATAEEVRLARRVRRTASPAPAERSRSSSREPAQAGCGASATAPARAVTRAEGRRRARARIRAPAERATAILRAGLVLQAVEDGRYSR